MKKNIIFAFNLLLISSLSFGQKAVSTKKSTPSKVVKTTEITKTISTTTSLSTPSTSPASNASITASPTAEQVIDNYINAIGGKEAIAKIKDFSITMSGEVQGMALEILSQKKTGNKAFLTVSVVGMGEMQKIQCDGTKARMTAQGKVTDIPANEIKSLVATQAGMFPEANYVSAGVKLTLAGIEKIEGKEVYKINAVIDDTKKWTDYYSVTTGLKVRQEVVVETPMGTNTVKISYDDYKDEAGVKIPHTLNQNIGPLEIELTASRIEMNKNLPDSLFEIN